MKKTIVILTLAVFVFGCAKKNMPSVSMSSSPSVGGGGKVIGNAPAASSSTTNTGAPAGAVDGSNGSKTSTKPTAAPSPEQQGQATYNGKCGKCHGLKVVSDYTADRWVSIMAVMGPKARLNDGETANVIAYVKANAKK